jgi:DNA-binding NarL/FixJ family response regulator/predicted Ser/Thr protein kinase
MVLMGMVPRLYHIGFVSLGMVNPERNTNLIDSCFHCASLRLKLKYPYASSDDAKYLPPIVGYVGTERAVMSTSHSIVGKRFEVGQVIGSGTTGMVYLGRDIQTGQSVAIKELHKDILAGSPELVERFRREGEALRRLEHPNIVKVYSMAEEDGQHFMIMEYVSGGSLASLLQKTGQIPVSQTVVIGLELADALARAHHLGILHRDIKPANILLSEDGTPRLTDFGLARLDNSPSITTTGSLIGTPYYLSPEACYQQDIDERTDIWSFGVVLYEMVTGCRPFTGETIFDVTYAIKNQPVPEWALQRADIPQQLSALILLMLRKDRAARLGSARQVGVELEKVQNLINSSDYRKQTPGSVIQPAEPGKIRILIVDDHAVVRQGLRTFIDLQEDMTVVGEGNDGLEAVDLAGRLKPDIILLDLVMPRMNGVDATQKILANNPSCKVLILTSFGEDKMVFPAIRNGAQGYLLKDIQPDDLVKAIRSANLGNVQLHPDIAKKLMASVASPGIQQDMKFDEPHRAAGEPQLTDREIEVLRYIARGLSNRDIAKEMVISEKTVKTHVSSILGKLGVEDRTQAAIWAVKNGMGA